MQTKKCIGCKLLLPLGNFTMRPDKHGLRSRCSSCTSTLASHYRKARPWRKHYCNARIRCTCKSHKQYKNYGGRGIKLLMDVADFKILWFSDKAYLMKNPSIDRKENDGHYQLNNCRFIEKMNNLKTTKEK